MNNHYSRSRNDKTRWFGRSETLDLLLLIQFLKRALILINRLSAASGIRFIKLSHRLFCFFLACETANLCLNWAGLCQAFAGGEGKGNLAADNPRMGTASGERRGSSPPRAGCRSAWTSASVAHPKRSSRAAAQPAVCCLQTRGKQLLGRAKAVGELLLRAVRAVSLCYADLVCSSCL